MSRRLLDTKPGYALYEYDGSELRRRAVWEPRSALGRSVRLFANAVSRINAPRRMSGAPSPDSLSATRIPTSTGVSQGTSTTVLEPSSIRMCTVSPRMRVTVPFACSIASLYASRIRSI